MFCPFNNNLYITHLPASRSFISRMNNNEFDSVILCDNGMVYNVPVSDMRNHLENVNIE